MLPKEYNPRSVRPMSEIINPNRMNEDMTSTWFEDLKNYERNLDEMASTTLDINFKEEMQHVDQWYRYLTEAEKTATMYTLLQHSTQVQVRFFMNILQQMIKRDSLYSILTPNNDQDMQSHLAGAMAKAEVEASQRLMSVLPYKTGVVTRPPNNNRRAMDRHSFALGDTEEYNRLFNRNDLLNNRSPFHVEDNRRMMRNMNASGRTHTIYSNSRPHSVIEGDTPLFTTSNTTNNNNNTSWLNTSSNNNNIMRRPPVVGHIGDRKPMPERPKSADITHYLENTTWKQDDIDFSLPRRRPVNRIPAVPETEEVVKSNQDYQYPPMDHFVFNPLNDMPENEYPSDHSEGSPRRISMTTSRATKDKKAVEVVDMELLKDVPTWLRSLRLHKYNPIFHDCTWQEMVKMSDHDLLLKGVAALGARRKMLKVFEIVKAHCDANNIEY